MLPRRANGWLVNVGGRRASQYVGSVGWTARDEPGPVQRPLASLHPGVQRQAPFGKLEPTAFCEEPQAFTPFSGVTAWRRPRDRTRPASGPACTPRCGPTCAARTFWTRTTAPWTTAPWTARTSGPSKGGSRRSRPVDRARPGSEHHVIVDRHGTPPAVTLTGGTGHDVTQLMPLLDAVPPIRGLRGRPRRRPRGLFADGATTSTRTAAWCGSAASSR